MGMDVTGLNPTSEIGKHVHYSIHSWPRLWQFCCMIAPDIIDEKTARSCQYNDGKGMDAEKAKALAKRIRDTISSGVIPIPPPMRAGQIAAVFLLADVFGTPEMKDRALPFDMERVRRFVEFLEDCGGFEVW